MNNTHYITSDVISIEEVAQIIYERKQIALSEEAILNIEKCRAYLDTKMLNNDKPIYGINTGFGSLCNVIISDENLSKLQENLVKSHACGTGDEVPHEIVKLMLLLKIQSLSYGHSGVQLQTVNRLIDFYNNDILPIIYTQGSLGASGDLAPLAHLSLPLLGEGEVYYDGLRQPSHKVLEKMNWKPIVLQSKEGLALLNGTQFMSAYGVYSLIKISKLSYLADVIAAISLEGFDGRIEPFNELIHMVRPHKGQINTARRFNDLLEGSQIIAQEKKHVQDPYSFRCIPQVHGASKDAFDYAKKTFKTEINSVTDNPNIFIESDIIISGGNFHGQPLALALDFLGIAVAELGSISERRTYQLISGLRDLPPFLVSNPGLNSGFMIPQYTAASIASQNKQLATPASIDSIVSSNGQEDHVSMGANAATKTLKIVENLERILAIELMNASQAIEFRRPLQSSDFLEMFLKSFREEVPLVTEDRILHYDIEKAILFLNSFQIDDVA
ncbi:histidine ammonia-lyase [Flavobacterium psychrophilum]|uniref:Histidine ammonia-lyase n=1 Tax=Flavobacterium psychrophilum (strain ATCC 49511 / DSM 21280 / CIP 103535 / JIP02/86) TaxID=402612 RepID=A6GXW5_FLAPJ|nr:histidine ammonia-lyase [Flavobacterium psychrophilum]AIG29668.1 histidine ammonia-lyase [Flavobacterium psychrophilum]AIG31945.1 histidine ammonia-lyase [Flavobacterium psychrophilum]AIG34100.1 histidine ammonia-lyase [Flavobacterium psychrophilum]AIG36463.1 histidine ammonia-lyase [Flavobacterium psychrophilum]AIG38728.1 histidine ammonia-lyase [Flavobacterium psychrophilum]